MAEGWIKLHRSIWENPMLAGDPDKLSVWIYLLTSAAYDRRDAVLGGKRITLSRGQLITGRRKIAEQTGVEEHKVDRILKAFSREQQIEQRSTPHGSLITVINYDKYQQCEQRYEQQSEQRVSNDRATSEQRVSTIKELKEKREKEAVKNQQYRAPTAAELTASEAALNAAHERWIARAKKGGK